MEAAPDPERGLHPADLRSAADLLPPAWRLATFGLAAAAPPAESTAAIGWPRDLSHVPFDASLLQTLQDSGLSAQVMKRMRHEARRFREDGFFDPADPLTPADSTAERQRSRQAERILTRAVHRTLDQRLEESLRLTPGLGRFLSLLEGGRSGRAAPQPLDAAAPGMAPGDGAAAELEPPPRPSRTRDRAIGFKLDAHPRFIWRTRFAGLEGRVEVPVLQEPVRVSLERALGPRSGAALHGGLERDGRSWATLTFHLRF